MYGVQGGRSRCSPFWEDLMACAQEHGRRGQWEACQIQRDDYIECLHHKKLVSTIKRNLFPIVVILCMCILNKISWFWYSPLFPIIWLVLSEILLYNCKKSNQSGWRILMKTFIQCMHQYHTSCHFWLGLCQSQDIFIYHAL